MKQSDFNIIYDARVKREQSLRNAKNDEYARDDTLSNIKAAGIFLGVQPETALMGFVIKHFIAIRTFIRDIESGNLQSYEKWDEKISDIRIYMALLDGLLHERGLSYSHSTDNGGTPPLRNGK